jgi:hypothetical protein
LAKWHVDGPQKIIDSLAEMAELEKVGENGPSDEALEKESIAGAAV